MTLDEIAFNIKNIAEGGISGEDSNLSIRQIKFMIDYHRANLLLKYTDGGRYTSEPMYQTITDEFNNGSYEMESPILGFANNRAIREIFLVKNTGTQSENNKIILPIMSDGDREFFEASRFAPNKSHFFATISGQVINIFDNDSQLVQDSTLDIGITAIFARPQSINSGSEYPIPAELVPSLTETVLAKEFGVYLRTVADSANNTANDKIANPVAKQVAATPNANARSKARRTR
jgi:hypothetical protein